MRVIHVLIGYVLLTTAFTMMASPTAWASGVRATNAATSTSYITGEVRDGRSKTPTTIIPDELPPIEGALVTVPNLGLSATTDQHGRFRFDNISVPLGLVRNDYIKVTVSVSKAGFGRWTLTGAPVYARNNYLDVYVELADAPYTETYVPGEERTTPPRPQSSAADVEQLRTTSGGGKLASPAPNGCVPGPETFTGYNSQAYPPGSIRVLRRATGLVETVNFVFYVKSVLPNEWIAGSGLTESLRAGAVAVKNYGWFQVNVAIGNDPPFNYGGFSGGKCWDVDDGQRYQVYNPSVRNGNTDNAVAWTWDAVVRPLGDNNALHHTLYFDGSSVCAPNYGPDPINNPMWGKWMTQNGADECARAPLNKTWWQILAVFYVDTYGDPNISIDFVNAGPAVAAPPTGDRIDVFVRGSDNQIHQKFWPLNGQWSGWYGAETLGYLGVGAVSDPAASWSNGMNRLDVAVRGNDGNLWVDTWTAATGWTGWGNLGVGLSTGPGIAGQRNGPRVDMLWRNDGNQLQWHSFSGSGGWTYKGALPALPANNSVPTDNSALFPPTATWGWNNGSLRAYTASNDPNEQAYTNSTTGTIWGSWSAMGYGDLVTPCTSPAFNCASGVASKVTGASKYASNRTDYFIRRSNDQIQWRYNNAGSLSSWVSLGAPVGAQVDSGAGAIWWQNDGMLDLFVRGKDGHLWQARSTNGSTWNGWIADLGAYP